MESWTHNKTFRKQGRKKRVAQVLTKEKKTLLRRPINKLYPVTIDETSNQLEEDTIGKSNQVQAPEHCDNNIKIRFIDELKDIGNVFAGGSVP